MTARTLPAGKRETARPMTRPEELAREACMVDRIRGGPTNIASRADVAAAIRKAVGEALGEAAKLDTVFERAHTYTSENAEHYRSFDKGQLHALNRAQTDIRKTFARIRKQIEESKLAERTPAKVSPLKRKTA